MLGDHTKFIVLEASERLAQCRHQQPEAAGITLNEQPPPPSIQSLQSLSPVCTSPT